MPASTSRKTRHRLLISGKLREPPGWCFVARIQNPSATRAAVPTFSFAELDRHVNLTGW